MFTFLVGSLLLLFSLLVWRKGKHNGGHFDDFMDVRHVDGDHLPENIAGISDDIIIVGAGVAGSALAYTLAKVTNIFSNMLCVYVCV